MVFQIDLKQSAPVEAEARRLFKQAVDTAALDLADYLQRESPVGVTGELKAGWDVQPSKKSRGLIPEVLGRVTNSANAAEFRIRGRAPGKFPPYGDGTPLSDWAAAVGIPAFLVARAIATKGTQRWRQGAKGNILKQDPVTLKFDPDSPIFTVYLKRLAEEWDRIKL